MTESRVVTVASECFLMTIEWIPTDKPPNQRLSARGVQEEICTKVAFRISVTNILRNRCVTFEHICSGIKTGTWEIIVEPVGKNVSIPTMEGNDVHRKNFKKLVEGSRSSHKRGQRRIGARGKLFAIQSYCRL